MVSSIKRGVGPQASKRPFSSKSQSKDLEINPRPRIYKRHTKPFCRLHQYNGEKLVQKNEVMTTTQVHDDLSWLCQGQVSALHAQNMC